MILNFGAYEIDVERRELRRAKTPVHVEPQVFDLLVYLVRNRDRVVSKDDLIASVWGGRIVSHSTLTSRINAARKAVGDSGEDQKLIRTVARKGFRFVGTVRAQSNAEPAQTRFVAG
jgi:DNA-binding winged helix-turn-helix (wHTH) protein